MAKKLLIYLFLLCAACTEEPPVRDARSETLPEKVSRTQKKLKGAYLQQRQATPLPPPPLKNPPPTYPWHANRVRNHPRITKDFFRCQGSILNSSRPEIENGETVHIDDCGGADRHSLPLCNGHEFIYPILIDLLNYLQLVMDKRVVITSGHRCPQHNRYVDSSISNSISKHQIGAEVSFYVQGLEEEPEKVVEQIMHYYSDHPQTEYRVFERYAKADTNVSVQPWYNKEIFLKLFKKTEGRNFDNHHPYPYIAIQVRYDPVKKERVLYSWKQSHQNYLKE